MSFLFILCPSPHRFWYKVLLKTLERFCIYRGKDLMGSQLYEVSENLRIRGSEVLIVQKKY